MTPQYRIEQYLAAINAAYLGESPLPEYPAEPVWRIEGFLAAILSAAKGDSPVRACPDPVWHIEEFARAIYDALVGASPAWPCPTATNNIEAILHAIYKVVADGTETDGIATSWDIERWLLDSYDAAKEGGGGGTATTLSGNLPLVLQNALAKAAKSLTRYGLVTQPPKVYYDSLTQKGKCTQDGTPTSSVPVDIMCNNGALKWDSVNQRVYTDGTPEVLTVFENLLNPATNITGKYIKENGSIGTAGDSQYTDLIPVEAGETYVCSFVSGRNSGAEGLHGYNSSGEWVKRLASASAEGQQGLKIAMVATIDSGISYVRLSYGITDTDARVEKTNYDPLINTFYEAATDNGIPIIKDSSTPVQSPYNSTWKVGVCFEAIPGGEYAFSHDVFQNGTYASGNILHVGFYEKAEDVTDKSKCLSHLKGVQCFTVPNEAHYVVIEFDGAKPITFSFVGVAKVDSGYQRQTASVPMLLSVGDVKDEVELIHGTLTRRVTACLYDGTQPVGDVYMSTTGGKDAGAIIVYPLATATTEQITAQHLTMSPNSDVSIVANVPDVEAEIGHSEYTMPSPEYPLPLFCNNGELKWNGTGVVADGTPEVLTVSGKNLLNAATNITGKYIASNGSISNGDDAQYTDLIPVKEGETYVASLVSGRNNGTNRWHGYNANGGWVKQIAYVSASDQQGNKLVMTAMIDSGISYVRLSYGINDTEAMIERAYTTEFYESKSISRTGYLINTTEKIQSPYSGANRPGFLVEVTPGTTYYVLSNVTRNGIKVAAGNTDIGFYASIEDVTNVSSNLGCVVDNKFTAPSNANYAVVCFNAGPGTEYEYTFSYGVALCIDYQPYVTPQTASVPMLLSVGDYKDEAEIISGINTGMVGIYVFDGTETWTTDTFGGYRRMVLQEVLNASGDTLPVLCSHYASRAADARQQPNSIFIASSGKLVIYVDSTQNISTVEEFNTWLAAQYTNGTPVIAIYPLAEETTEHITGQNLVMNEGTNIVDSVANVSPLAAEVKYMAASEQVAG